MNSTLVQTDVGDLWYPEGDGGVTTIVQRDGLWEKAEGDLIRYYLHPGDTFVDVGAHVGYFSVMAAQIVGDEGSVISIEPVENNATLLSKNLESYTNCVMIEAAAWSGAGTAEIYCNSFNSGDNRLFDHTESVPPVSIPTFPLDDLKIRRLDLLKVDTQGTDHVVLSGARGTIKRCNPLIIVEWWPEGIRGYGSDPLKVLEFYDKLGYELSSIGVDKIPFKDGYCSLLLEPK